MLVIRIFEPTMDGYPYLFRVNFDSDAEHEDFLKWLKNPSNRKNKTKMAHDLYGDREYYLYFSDQTDAAIFILHFS